MSERAMDEDELPDSPAPPPRTVGHSRPARAGIFRRRMILQLTSLLDLLLIIVFVQYLEMQQISARAIAHEAARRKQAEAAQVEAASERDLLLHARDHNFYDVWVVHVNGDQSVYPDGSVLVTSPTRKKVFQPAPGEDFVAQLASAMRGGPPPKSPCILLLTYGDVRRDLVGEVRGELDAAAADRRLQAGWGGDPVRFVVVDGGYSPDAQ